MNQVMLRDQHDIANNMSIVPTISQDEVFDMVSNARPAREFLNLELDVVGIYAEQGEFADQKTGEMLPGVVVFILLQDGSSVVNRSKSFFRGMQRFFSFFDRPSTWSGPKKIKITREPGQNGWEFYSIRTVAPKGNKK